MSETASNNLPPVKSGFRKILVMASGALLVAGLFVFAGWYLTCPCETVPGAVLWGEVVEEPVTDWSFANDSELCQIQVGGPIITQALNLNCMATDQGELYLSCTQCAPKRWSKVVAENPDGRIRVNGRVYPVRITQVTEPQEKDRSCNARLQKLINSTVLGGGTPIGTPRPSDDQWWTFRVVSANH